MKFLAGCVRLKVRAIGTFSRWTLPLFFVALALSTAHAAPQPKPAAEAPPAKKLTPAPRRTWEFKEDGVTFDSRFAAARLSECTRQGPGQYLVVTEPENKPINASAWFAFKVSATALREIAVQIKCDGASLRYRPKISVDGISWLPLPLEPTDKTTNKSSGIIRLKVGPEPLWVAAQEIVNVAWLEAWSRNLEHLPFVKRSEIGRSLAGKPLYKLEIGAAKSPAFVSIVGRQHPPEVTGTLALMRFVEALVSDTPLACSFRQEFIVHLVPLINPDGVEQGHWRHNLNGVDLNRDWETFYQPETRAVRDQILALPSRGKVFLHLDFHSTFDDVFYTQTDDEPANPPDFTKRWIEGLQQRFPDYHVKRVSNHLPTSYTSHNWAHRALGIPGITYEIGDNTDRALLQQIANGAAEEMMTLLLEMKKTAKR